MCAPVGTRAANPSARSNVGVAALRAGAACVQQFAASSSRLRGPPFLPRASHHRSSSCRRFEPRSTPTAQHSSRCRWRLRCQPARALGPEVVTAPLLKVPAHCSAAATPSRLPRCCAPSTDARLAAACATAFLSATPYPRLSRMPALSATPASASTARAPACAGDEYHGGEDGDGAPASCGLRHRFANHLRPMDCKSHALARRQRRRRWRRAPRRLAGPRCSRACMTRRHPARHARRS